MELVLQKREVLGSSEPVFNRLGQASTAPTRTSSQVGQPNTAASTTIAMMTMRCISAPESITYANLCLAKTNIHQSAYHRPCSALAVPGRSERPRPGPRADGAERRWQVFGRPDEIPRTFNIADSTKVQVCPLMPLRLVLVHMLALSTRAASGLMC
jgi:hypothetical protein